jgi:hypothetical protein
MVDPKHMHAKLNKYFHVEGDVHITPEGIVNVDGSIRLKKSCAELPVQFGEVTNLFICDRKGLTTLKGSPRNVHDFDCSHNNLTSLKGGPWHVDGDFNCSSNRLTHLTGAPIHVGRSLGVGFNPLISLTGIPEHVRGSVWVVPTPQLGILRLCTYDRVDVMGWNPELAAIIQKYEGQGKPGALKAAAELVRAGFKDNARW